MINEEKAEEICKRHIFDSNHYDCCMEMAQWKDSQFEKIIDVVIEQFNQYPDNAAFGKSNMIDMLIEIKKVVG